MKPNGPSIFTVEEADKQRACTTNNDLDALNVEDNILSLKNDSTRNLSLLKVVIFLTQNTKPFVNK